MSTPLWMAIEPCSTETRLLLTVPFDGTALKARLPPLPADPRAVSMLLESLSLWYRRPLSAALDADALGVQHHPEIWSVALAELPSLDINVEFVGHTKGRRLRDRFLGGMGAFDNAKRVLAIAATGQQR